MRNLKAPFVLALAWMLAACQLFGVESPNTFNQRLAYVYSTQTAVAQEIATKTRTGQISSSDNARFVSMLENAKQIADGAQEAMQGNDTATAEGKLKLAKSILAEVDQYVGAL